MVVTVSNKGYIKRVPLSTYRAQRRGGKGRAGMATREEDFVEQVFVASTHAPLLFFSSRGLVYKLKVYRLPLALPQARGKAMVNLLPLAADETISTVMPLPEDEAGARDLDVMFATASGDVRRNPLSDFTNVMANGKIAMKLASGDVLVGVATCGASDHVLLATRNGKCIRFPVDDVRVFRSRNSTGVSGIRLGDDDRVISLTILVGAEFAAAERDSYLRLAAQRRRDGDEMVETAGEVADEEVSEIVPLSEERIAQLQAQEQFILTVAANGFGKRSSAYDYRVTGRGGKGIELMDLGPTGKAVVAAFPVLDGDQAVLVTDGGQLIRFPIADIRIARRMTRGVKLFHLAEGERVVSVARLAEETGEGSGDDPLVGAAGDP